MFIGGLNLAELASFWVHLLLHSFNIMEIQYNYNTISFNGTKM